MKLTSQRVCKMAETVIRGARAYPNGSEATLPNGERVTIHSLKHELCKDRFPDMNPMFIVSKIQYSTIPKPVGSMA